MSGWSLSNQLNKSVLGGPYALVALFSSLSLFFLLSGLREASTVLLENILSSFLCTLSPLVVDAGGMVGLSYPSSWADSMIGPSCNFFDFLTAGKRGTWASTVSS